MAARFDTRKLIGKFAAEYFTTIDKGRRMPPRREQARRAREWNAERERQTPRITADELPF